jgi:hypothetical protein
MMGITIFGLGNFQFWLREATKLSLLTSSSSRAKLDNWLELTDLGFINDISVPEAVILPHMKRYVDSMVWSTP